MNCGVGLLAFFLYFAPIIAMLVFLYQKDKKFEKEYNRKIKEIEEKYYGNTSKT